MLIAAGSLTEFIQFLQIFLWITIPLFVSAIIITTIVHYKRKIGKRTQVDDIPSSMLFSFENNPELPFVPGDQILKASIDQLNNFRHKLFFSNARYSVLKQDLETLEEKYNQVLLNKQNIESSKIYNMNLSAEDAQREMQFQLDRLNEEYAAEKENLLGHLNMLNGRCLKLEEENNVLKEQSSFIKNGIDDSLVTHLQKERTELKNKVSALQFVEDMIEEKQLHINFLQQQLDQRIKNYHTLEQQFGDAAADNMEIKLINENSALRINSLEKEIIERDEQDHQLQELFEEKNSTIAMLTEDLRIKADRLVYLENAFNDVRHRNEQLGTAADEKDSLINNLRLQLHTVEEKIIKLSAKLDTNRKLMAKMNDEMTSVLQEDSRSSPVITMNTDYLLSGNDDEVVASSQSL